MLAPATVGGLERVVQTLSIGLHESDHSLLVCPVASGDDPLEPFMGPLEDAGVAVAPVRVPHRRYLTERREVKRTIAQFRPEVVHTHGARVDVVDSGAARSLGVPTVTTVHGFTGGGLKNRIYEALQRWFFRRFDAVVAVSAPQAAELRDAGVPEHSLTTIPNARPVQSALLDSGEARERLAVSDDAFHIGWVGRLSREKGADVLLDALSALEREVPCVVSIVGDGPERETLEERSGRLEAARSVRWHGTVPEAGRLFRAFDVFVLSSRTEGTPIALFEAMHAGTPIVATRVGGVPDVVSENEALLVPPERPDRLAGAIREVFRDPGAARRRAARASRRLEERFGRERWVRRYEELYRSLLADSSASDARPS